MYIYIYTCYNELLGVESKISPKIRGVLLGAKKRSSPWSFRRCLFGGKSGDSGDKHNYLGRPVHSTAESAPAQPQAGPPLPEALQPQDKYIRLFKRITLQ